MRRKQKYIAYKIGKFTTSNTEIGDILRAWLAISIAFAIVLGGFSLTFQFVQQFIIAAITVGTGFLFHEMMHKIVAQRYKCFAEFRAQDFMLLLAIGMSFFGFIFAAPGAVMIMARNLPLHQLGKISVAGPLTNYIIAILFLILTPFSGSAFWQMLTQYGFLINAWLGLFNMIPFFPFDGKKVLMWNKRIYGAMVIFGVLLVFGRGFF